MNHAHQPIGVFDSGVGGLTVLQALKRQCPNEDFIYLGDTARLPYGTKSPETITQYAMSAYRLLAERHIKLLVVACNTAATIALQPLQQHHPELPIIGVVEPGAHAACQQSSRQSIAVIATETTVASGGYQRAISKFRPNAQVIAQSTSLLVALAEEGWVQGPLVEGIIQSYLEPLFGQSNTNPDCLLLGCTHFPILKPAIMKVIAPEIQLVDSAQATADEVARILKERKLSNDRGGSAEYLVTDCPQRFLRVARYFLDNDLEPGKVHLV